MVLVKADWLKHCGSRWVDLWFMGFDFGWILMGFGVGICYGFWFRDGFFLLDLYFVGSSCVDFVLIFCGFLCIYRFMVVVVGCYRSGGVGGRFGEVVVDWQWLVYRFRCCVCVGVYRFGYCVWVWVLCVWWLMWVCDGGFRSSGLLGGLVGLFGVFGDGTMMWWLLVA